MNLLIISDLHAHSKASTDMGVPSFLYAKNDPDKKHTNVLALIPDVIKNEGIKIDLLLCPGDIADKADPTAQEFAWRELNNVKKKVGAKALIASAGNHDVDSRLKTAEFDPKGALLSLSPPFPGASFAENNKYWAQNYHIYSNNDVRIVNLNSSAFHGYHSDENKDSTKSEYRHGRVSQKTINKICAEVKKKEFRLNILLTHHHLYKNDAVYDDDYSEMTYGSRLLDRLMQVTGSSWLVIHGHQHLPQITYSVSRSHSSVLFSAGSLSASLAAPYSAEAPNQFYVISLEMDHSLTGGWNPCGTVRAWQWTRRHEWIRSQGPGGIIDRTGFGCRALGSDIASDILIAFNKEGQQCLTGEEICNLVPQLRYLTAQAREEVILKLSSLGLKWAGDLDFHASVLRRK